MEGGSSWGDGQSGQSALSEHDTARTPASVEVRRSEAGVDHETGRAVGKSEASAGPGGPSRRQRRRREAPSPRHPTYSPGMGIQHPHPGGSPPADPMLHGRGLPGAPARLRQDPCVREIGRQVPVRLERALALCAAFRAYCEKKDMVSASRYSFLSSRVDYTRGIGDTRREGTHNADSAHPSLDSLRASSTPARSALSAPTHKWPVIRMQLLVPLAVE